MEVGGLVGCGLVPPEDLIDGLMLGNEGFVIFQDLQSQMLVETIDDFPQALHTEANKASEENEQMFGKVALIASASVGIQQVFLA